jgi:hypothetical protein
VFLQGALAGRAHHRRRGQFVFERYGDTMTLLDWVGLLLLLFLIMPIVTARPSRY